MRYRATPAAWLLLAVLAGPAAAGEPVAAKEQAAAPGSTAEVLWTYDTDG